MLYPDQKETTIFQASEVTIWGISFAGGIVPVLRSWSLFRLHENPEELWGGFERQEQNRWVLLVFPRLPRGIRKDAERSGTLSSETLALPFSPTFKGIFILCPHLTGVFAFTYLVTIIVMSSGTSRSRAQIFTFICNGAAYLNERLWEVRQRGFGTLFLTFK